MDRCPQYRMDRYASLMNDFSLDEFSFIELQTSIARPSGTKVFLYGPITI